MKKNILIILSSIFYLLNAEVINLNNNETDLVLINHGDFIQGTVSIKELEYYNTNYKNNDFTIINIPGYHFSQDIGLPELPQINKLIEIPQDAIPRIEIISQEVSYYQLDELNINNPIFPHQPSLSKSQTIDDVSLYWDNNYYSNNSFNNKNIVTLDIKGTLRSARIGNLNINPINYNPVKKTLKILKNIEFNIYFDDANYIKTNKLKNKYYSPYYNDIYKTIPFDLNSLINAENIFQTLDGSDSRALIYQKFLLSDDNENKVKMLFLLEDLFKKDNLSNIFTIL